MRAFLIRLYQSPIEWIQRVCMWVGAFVLLCSAGAIAGIVFFFSSLPNVQEMTYGEVRIRAEKHVQKLVKSRAPLRWTSIDQVNRELIYAIVMSEDAAFFEHEGVNFDAMIGAALQNLRKKKYQAGASTISQQVTKNLFLTQDKTIARKIKEVIVTRRVEARFTKNEILELYLNLAEFGPDVYGIQAAASHYFKKNPAQINAAEGAFLALMLPSPRKFHFSVFENQNITLSKKKKLRRILGDMLSQELISAKQYRQYIRYDYFPDEDRTPAQIQK